MKSDNFVYRIRRVIQSALVIIAFSIILWEFSPYSRWFAGMILGIVTGILSSIYAAWKVHKVIEIASQTEGKQKKPSLGTLTRYSLAILATVVAMQFPEIFSVAGMTLGICLLPIVAYIDAVYMNTKENSGRKG